MSLTITSQDLFNLARNDLSVVSHIAVGFIAAAATNEAIHELFHVRSGTKMSYAINAYTLVTATIMVSGISLLPYPLLVSFTTRKVIELAAINLIASSCLSLATRRIIYIPCAEGALLGLLGPWTLMPIGISSALIGVVVTNGIIHDDENKRLMRAVRNYVQGALGAIHRVIGYATEGEM